MLNFHVRFIIITKILLRYDEAILLQSLLTKTISRLEVESQITEE